MDDTMRPARSLTQRRIRASQLEVAYTALELIERDGWDAMGVAELAQAVGLSTRTFYRYFPSKRDVFRPLLAEAGSRSRGRFGRPTAADFPHRCADALVTGVEAFPGGLEGAHRAYRILLSTPELTPVWLDEGLTFEQELIPLLRRDRLHAQSPGGVDGGRLLAALVFAGMRVAIQTWVEGSEPAVLHQLSVDAVSRTLRGDSDLSPWIP